VHALLSVIRDLSQRPRWSRSASGSLRGDRPLPLLCLIQGSAHSDILSALEKRLDEAEPTKVPFAAVDAERVAEWVTNRWAGTTREMPLLPLLDELRHRLMADRFGDRRLSRFRHYRLADWLTGRRLSPGENRNERADVTDMLRVWHARKEKPAAALEAAIVEAVAAQSAWMKVMVALFAAWHRPLRFWLWAHGVRPLGREPRWLMRQPFMVPGHSTSFTGFTERLTAGRRNEENLEQIKKLLVHAFLQDLRVVYGAGSLRLRLRRWRRTAYTLVLLENITEDNGGWELLRLINDVRNESTEHDPVLVVATATEPPGWLESNRPLPPVNRVQAELDVWYRRLPARRQSLRGDARFITVSLPSTREQDPSPSDADESAWYTLGDFRPRSVPIPARKSFLAAALAVVLLAAALTGGRWLWVRLGQDCLPSASSGVGVEWIPGEQDGECVGYSDSSTQVFGNDERLRKAQLAVFELNATAEQLHADSPARPIVSVVYFAEFTNPKQKVGSADAVTEELTGLLAQQAQNNIKSDLSSPPLLRVIVANGGYQMGQARTVVNDLLAPLFEADATAMGVLGMGRTVDATESAICALGDMGIPVVATTLTGETLVDRSPMYFQLVPGNKAQAVLVKKYASNKQITVYQPEKIDDDGYMKSLRQQMIGKDTDGTKLSTWKGEVGSVDPSCGIDQLAFFAGRETDFDGFLNRVLVECKNKGIPIVLGDDAVTRFVAQGSKRQKYTSHPGPSVSYVSLGGPVVIKNRSCLTPANSVKEITPLCSGLLEMRHPKQAHGPAWNDFGQLLVDSTDSLPWVGERIGIAYDGAGLFIQAVVHNKVHRLRIDPSGLAPNRAAITQELRELSCPQDPKAPRGNCYDGASGEIDFSTSTGRSGESRPISILTISDISNLQEVPSLSYTLIVPEKPNGCSPPK
jgi:hypothetical protein